MTLWFAMAGVILLIGMFGIFAANMAHKQKLRDKSQ